MKVGIYSLLSPVHEQEAISQTLEQFIRDLSKNITLEEIDKEILKSNKKYDYDLIAVFVKTGGTENLFKDIFDKLDQPVILIATSLHNSLAASMEILSWINSQNKKGRILHGKPSEIAKNLRELVKINKTKERIRNSRLGLLGSPSDWLIASDINKEVVKKRWGLEIIDVSIEEVIEEFNKIADNQVKKLVKEFKKRAKSVEEPSEKDLIKATRVYYALRNIVNKYNLNSLTIRCFDLVTKLETTGCLALSLLNNESIIAGCEGDIPATVSMMIIYYLTDSIPFMANPVSLNINKNKVKFAHCTVASNSVNSYIIRSHFESSIGVGIQGELRKGDITLFKLGGKNLNHYANKNATLINNLNSEFACRTQVLVDFDDNDIDYFLKNPVGNHHILVSGDHLELLNKFIESLDFKTINHW